MDTVVFAGGGCPLQAPTFDARPAASSPSGIHIALRLEILRVITSTPHEHGTSSCKMQATAINSAGESTP
jgi:hypothetical protein